MRRQKLVSDDARRLFPDGYRVLQGTQEFVTYPDDSTIRVWLGETPDSFAPHWHTAAEILMVLDGECQSEVGDTRYRVRQGEVLVMPPRCTHTLSMGEGSRRCLILFETDAMEQMRDFAPLLRAHLQPLHLSAERAQNSGMLSTLNHIISIYRFHEPMWNMQCYSLLFQMSAKLGQMDVLMERPESAANVPERRMISSPQIMESVLGYIGQNYMRDVTLEEMADYSGYSKWYFSRMFRQYAGMPFMQYLTQVRVANIRQKLIHQDCSVAEIYAQSGFSSISTFNRVFKEVNGCTPSEYRTIYGKRRSALDTVDAAD